MSTLYQVFTQQGEQRGAWSGRVHTKFRSRVLSSDIILLQAFLPCLSSVQYGLFLLQQGFRPNLITEWALALQVESKHPFGLGYLGAGPQVEAHPGKLIKRLMKAEPKLKTTRCRTAAK
jgi:hypothetical protein